MPAFLLCGELWVGLSTGVTDRRLEARVRGAPQRPDSSSAIDVPPWGRVELERLGLPAFTLVVGLLDGLNPCALWVLLLLLSLVVHLRSRARVLLVAGTFVLTSGLVDFAFMAAWLHAFLWVGYSRALQLALGLAAVGIGCIHVKDFFAPGSGLSLSIPQRAKPGLYARMRRVVYAENLGAALAAALVLALLVNAVELLCTAALPALDTQVLSAQGLSGAGYYGYLALYHAAYVLDDALVVGAAVWALRSAQLQVDPGRWLKLASGCAILALGLLLAFAPELLMGAAERSAAHGSGR